MKNTTSTSKGTKKIMLFVFLLFKSDYDRACEDLNSNA